VTYVDTCWHLLAIQVRFSGSLVVTTMCCAVRGWNLPPLRHHWTYTSWRLAAASIDSLPYSAWVTIYFSPILYTQWQWRNFVPYLCQLIFAAISFVNFGTKKRIRMELFAMAHVYTQDRPSPLIGNCFNPTVTVRSSVMLLTLCAIFSTYFTCRCRIV